MNLIFSRSLDQCLASFPLWKPAGRAADVRTPPKACRASKDAPYRELNVFAEVFKSRFERSFGSGFVALANEADQTAQMLGLENEFSVDQDGWVKISPYGDFPKERTVRKPDGTLATERYVQRVDRPAAEAMVSKFNSIWGRLKRFIVGVPIFKRHPDLSTHSPETVTPLANDKAPYGMFSELQAREDGFYGRPVMTEHGRAAIENEGLKWISPFWWLRILGDQDGAKIVSPYELISGGLTDRPNIQGGQALANQHEPQPQTHMDKAILIALLNLAHNAGEGDITRSINDLKAKADRVTSLENEKNSSATALENEKQSHQQAQQAFATERKARIELLLDKAVVEGRVTAAERPTWATALANDSQFEEKAAALANEKPKVKTQPATGNLGARKAEISTQEAATSKFVALVNERMLKCGGTWEANWIAAKTEHADIWDQANQAVQ